MAATRIALCVGESGVTFRQLFSAVNAPLQPVNMTLTEEDLRSHDDLYRRAGEGAKRTGTTDGAKGGDFGVNGRNAIDHVYNRTTQK